jgi:hypothetical protein
MLILRPEKIGNVIKLGIEDIELQVHFSGESYINVGGQQYRQTSSLQMDATVSGFGGLDTGALGALEYWYLYVVVQNGIVGLVASKTSEESGGPSVFTGFRLVGRFVTNSSSEIVSVVNTEKSYTYFEIYGGNGQGSVDTVIRKFSTKSIAINDGLLVKHSSTTSNGDIFEIVKDCQVNVSHVDFVTSGAELHGFSVNSNELTTDIRNINPVHRKIHAHVSSTVPLRNGVSWSGKLGANDKLRIHCSGVSANWTTGNEAKVSLFAREL